MTNIPQDIRDLRDAQTLLAGYCDLTSHSSGLVEKANIAHDALEEMIHFLLEEQETQLLDATDAIENESKKKD